MRAGTVGAVVVVLVAGAIAAEAMTFDVAFPTDPLGPKAFPLLSAVLLALGGLALLGHGARARRPGSAGSGRGPAVGGPGAAGPSDPDNSGVAADDGPSVPAAAEPSAAAARAARVRIALGSLSFILYAVALAPIGFVPATTLEFAALAWLFGGRALQGGVVGLVFAGALYGVFVYGLGLPLPLGLLAR